MVLCHEVCDLSYKIRTAGVVSGCRTYRVVQQSICDLEFLSYPDKLSLSQTGGDDLIVVLSNLSQPTSGKILSNFLREKTFLLRAVISFTQERRVIIALVSRPHAKATLGRTLDFERWCRFHGRGGSYKP
jgi:hypothetical protein